MSAPDKDVSENPLVREFLASGIQLQKRGDLSGAERDFRQVLSRDPQHQDALFRLGVVCLQQGKQLDAVSALQKVLQLDPQHVQAHNNLGVLLAQQGRFDPAIVCFQEALRLKPNSADAQGNLQRALADRKQRGGDFAGNETCFKVSLATAEFHYAQGMALLAQHQSEQAMAELLEALRINPDHAMAHYGLGLAYAEQGQIVEALASFEQTLRYAPDSADVRYDRARVLLQLGDFERGWREFECRWKSSGAESRAFTQPVWDGAPLEGRTILLHGEQGIGDVFQFIRYAQRVKESGGTVLVACPPSLHRILSSCPGVDRMVGMGPDFPPFDVHAPLMSLPSLFRTTLATVPADVPYLFPDSERMAYWRRELGEIPGFKVGIVWQGSPTYRGDHQRSIPLQHFAPLAQVSGVRLISLQKGPGAEQLRAVADRWPIADWDRRIDENAGSFMDTAAIMKSLDLVITSDTSAAHLAGALSAPVWVVHWQVPEWRWLLNRDTSPWYPTMRLFRQARRGDWGELFSRVARELSTLISGGI